MYNKSTNLLITTIKERCRVCYTCVRECPAKAIRISGGQAEVVPGRCIGCGNCVRVCSQDAKQFLDSRSEVLELLRTKSKVVACIAPSFPADFYDLSPQKLVGILKKLGFDKVYEVAFGADLVAREMHYFLESSDAKRLISTTCPAVFEYVKCYHPDLTENLAPVVSPMIAMARVIKEINGNETKIVFIGPCIAKKAEASDLEVSGEIDEVLTFKELKQMIDEFQLISKDVQSLPFDEPIGGKGALFPLSRGMMQSVEVYEDLIKGDIITADGRYEFIDAIKEFESGDLNTKLLELLCCNGCIMGPGMVTDEPVFRRRARISKYVRNRMNEFDQNEFNKNIEKYSKLNLARTFIPNDQRTKSPEPEEIKDVLIRMGKVTLMDELNCGACGYESCREHAIAIIEGLAEDEMCLPYSIERLHKSVKQLEISNEQLARTREALNQSEKLASMGQLAAGIAHELNNPLGVVLMYANLVLEDIDKQSSTFEDLNIIAQEAERCKKIVSDLLNFARKNKVVFQHVNICDMVDQCLKVTQIPQNISVKTIHENLNLSADIDRDQILQVLNNLITNAINSMIMGGQLTVITSKNNKNIEIAIKDTGVGIPDSNIDKIFQPFFTTKQIGKGTGLGLAVTYGIIKMHKGVIKVYSNAIPEKGQTGTVFTVILPIENCTN